MKIVSAFVLVSLLVTGFNISTDEPAKTNQEVLQPLNYTVNQYENGKANGIVAPEEMAKKEQAVLGYIERINDRPRLHMTAERMEQLLSTESSWEVVYAQPKKLKAGLYGEVEVKRVVVFTTGEFASSGTSKVVPIFTQSSLGDWQFWLSKEI